LIGRGNAASVRTIWRNDSRLISNNSQAVLNWTRIGLIVIKKPIHKRIWANYVFDSYIKKYSQHMLNILNELSIFTLTIFNWRSLYLIFIRRTSALLCARWCNGSNPVFYCIGSFWHVCSILRYLTINGICHCAN